MKRRTIYYTDELNDDFAGTNIVTKETPADYRYVRKNPLWHAAAFLLYHVVARPFAFAWAKLRYGLRVVGREKLRAARGKGVFLFGNHTLVAGDAFHPNLVTPGRRTYIVTGADAVSVHVNLGDENERDMLAQLGRVAESADNWGMPLLAMMYGRGPNIRNSYDPAVVAHCARVGVELGADVVKVPYTGDVDSFARVVDSCCVPVVIAGGPKTDTTREFLQMVYDSLQAGGAGLSVGRNIFQHPRRVLLLQALRGVVHENWTVAQALEVVGE